jgi:hypothetical protein
VVSVSVVETTEQVVVGQPVTETVVIDGSHEVNVTSTSVESVAVVHVTEQVAVSEPITETVVVNQGVLGEQGPPGADGDGTAYYGQVSRITSGTVNITAAGTYQSTGLTATLDAEAYGFVLGTTDTFALRNTSGETILTKFYASADIDAGSNKELGIKLALNGTPINETECRASTGTGHNFAKLITSWMIEVAPDDEVALFVTNFTNTGNVTVQRGRIIAVTPGRQGEQGIQGPPGPLQWIDYVSHWDTEPTEVSAGVLSYTWLGVTRYRNVPEPYVASSDAFYSDVGLTNLVIARGL